MLQPHVIGVDFDNTLVSYDDAFYRIARERDLVPCSIARSKSAVRDYIRRERSDLVWAELQGFVYGTRMDEAQLFPGVGQCLQIAAARGFTVVIISHKTRYAAVGPRYDLQQSARDWARRRGLSVAMHFAETRVEKIRLVAQIGCSCFIDDLPEVFEDREFPAAVRQVLFDPHQEYPHFDGLRVGSWPEITSRLFENDVVAYNR